MTDKLKTGDFGTFVFTTRFRNAYGYHKRKWIVEGMFVTEITDKKIILKDEEGALFKISPNWLESFHLYTKT